VKHLKLTTQDNSTIAAILAEALIKCGVSQVKVTHEQLHDLDFRHVTISVTEDPNTEVYIIRLRDRRHDTDYAEYEIIEEYKTIEEPVPQPKLLLPPEAHT
jgi:hypothetical protein